VFSFYDIFNPKVENHASLVVEPLLMVDPRLNSLHLPAPRRQDFRRAREVLLDARGEQTCYLERRNDAALPSPSGTIIQEEPAASSSCEFWLIDREHCVYPLHVGLNTLGRAPDNDVVLQDAFTSRRHCAILVHHRAECEIHDVASKNGTYLNGVRLSGPTVLRAGDEIRVCDQRFVLMSRAPDQRHTKTYSS
jgi:hypothetical protein